MLTEAPKKNKHAVALGRKGGLAGKGSEARKQAAIKANKARWANQSERGTSMCADPECLTCESVRAET